MGCPPGKNLVVTAVFTFKFPGQYHLKTYIARKSFYKIILYCCIKFP